MRKAFFKSIILISLTIFLTFQGLSHATSANKKVPSFTKAPETKDVSVPRNEMCENDKKGWNKRQKVLGVQIEESEQCDPDKPLVVAASTLGTNNVNKKVLMKTGYSKSAVWKGEDQDGDGDPDVINITLEVMEINGKKTSGASAGSITQEIAPGIEPGFWVFAPKTRGMPNEGTPASRLIRMPPPSIRVEKGDTVKVELQNTHYFPHTIHFHGVDHNFTVNGSGNDGVPQTSEKPVKPGGKRVYEFEPKTAGTFFYHCHVKPNTHVLMGLSGMFVVTGESNNNTVQTFNIGNGKVRNPPEKVDKKYDDVYDMSYRGVDKQLHNKIDYYDPRVIARKINREYDVTEREPDYYLLNGKSFPYTVRESQIIAEPNEKIKVRVLNAGSESISLHTHGHKPKITHLDGVKLDNPYQRDVISISAAQRVDFVINTTIDGFNSYGKGVWFMHNHKEEGVTTDGIAPGGDVTVITYKSFLNKDGLPKRLGVSWEKYFAEKYYEGKVPAWQNHVEMFGKIEKLPVSKTKISGIAFTGLIIGLLSSMVIFS